MKDTEFYENILGLRTPWTVEAVKLDAGNKSVEVKVKYEEGTLWASEAGERLPVYDHVERRWRHLDTCGFETAIVCRVPRVQTPEGKVENGAGAVGRPAQPFYAALRALCHRGAAGLPQRDRGGGALEPFLG